MIPARPIIDQAHEVLSFLQQVRADHSPATSEVVRIVLSAQLGVGLTGRDIGVLVGLSGKRCAQRMTDAGHPIVAHGPKRWALADVVKEFGGAAADDSPPTGGAGESAA